MVLVTTALREAFPRDTSEKVLFLGEWCKIYSKKRHWSAYDSITLDYYWGDREKILDGVKYTDGLYEKYLKILSEQLNKVHDQQYSERYWRILVGYWLRQFIDIVYDRYTLVEKAFSDNRISKTYRVNFEISDAAPFDMHDFNRIKVNDEWNHFIYSFLIRGKQCSVLGVDCKKISRKSPPGVSNKDRIKRVSMRLNRFNKIVFYISYIERKACAKLQLLLKQVPALDYIEKLTFFTNYDQSLREKLNLSTDQADKFELILQELIRIQIPCSYLESYKQLKEIALKRYSSRARLIIATPSSIAFHDDFKIWAAGKTDHEAKLVLTQHGGLYGTGVSNFLEEHEVAIADKFFSWGWTRRKYNNVYPMPAIKLLEMASHNPNGDILMPLLDTPRYSSFFIASEATSTQILDYLEDQEKFLSLVPNGIKKHIKLRLATASDVSGWNLEDRLCDKGFGGQIDSVENSNKRFIKRLSECRLCIATYNATTFLETFSNNFPTLLFWNERHCALNKEAKPYFDKLHRVGILHYDEKSLAAKVGEIYQNPMRWWECENIQQTKNEFCAQFANTGEDPIGKWSRELKKIANNEHF